MMSDIMIFPWDLFMLYHAAFQQASMVYCGNVNGVTLVSSSFVGFLMRTTKIDCN